MNEQIFIRLDVDNVGDSIELSLLRGDYNKAQLIHNQVQENINNILKKIEPIHSVIILMKGCDDILFSINKINYEIDFLENLKNDFKVNSNFTLSIGVGKSIRESMFNLRIAKMSGKDKIIEIYNSKQI